MTVRKSWFANLLLVAFGLALALVIGSLVRGFVQPPVNSSTLVACETAPIMLEVDALLRHVRPPCTPARFEFRDEYDSPVTFNNFGLHGPLYTLDKPAGVFRIVLVGDSFPQGVQVSMEEGFPLLLAQQLTGASGQRIEVINLGTDAYGTDRELLAYAVLGWQFQPDLVLLSLYPTNDVQDNQIDLEARRYGYKLDRPFFTLDANQLVLHNSALLKPEQYAGSIPYQWLVTMQASQQPAPPENPPERPAIISTDPYTLEYPVELGLYLPLDDHWRNAWDITEALLLQFRQLVIDSGVPFAVVIVPDRRAVHDADWQNTVYQYAEMFPELWESDPTAPGTHLEKFLRQNAVPVLNLTPALHGWASDHPDQRLYFVGDGHFNPQGHAVTADQLAAWLRANDLVP